MFANDRTKNNFRFLFPLTLPSPEKGEEFVEKLFFVRSLTAEVRT
jgi:hypothetical protein